MRKLTHITQADDGAFVASCLFINGQIVRKARLRVTCEGAYLCHDGPGANGASPADGNRLGYAHSWFFYPDAYVAGYSSVRDITVGFPLCPKEGL